MRVAPHRSSHGLQARALSRAAALCRRAALWEQRIHEPHGIKRLRMGAQLEAGGGGVAKH